MSTHRKYNIHCLVLLFIIGLISVHDTVLIFIYDSINQMEQNPIGNWLLDRGGVPLFMTVKSVTTLLSIILGAFLVRSRYKHKYHVILGVFIFQLSLLLYLNFWIDGRNPFIFNWGDHIPIFDVIRYYVSGELPDGSIYR